MSNLEVWEELISGYVICGLQQYDDGFEVEGNTCVREISHEGPCNEFVRFPIPQPCEPKWDFTSFVKDKVWTMHDDRLANMWEHMVGEKIKMNSEMTFAEFMRRYGGS
jgi:hypothetical protein